MPRRDSARRPFPGRFRDPKNAAAVWFAAKQESLHGGQSKVAAQVALEFLEAGGALSAPPWRRPLSAWAVICMQCSGESILDAGIVHGQSPVYGIGRQRIRKNSRAEALTMNRRDFLQSGGIAAASLAFAKAGPLFSQATTADHWRTFQVTTRVEVLKPSGTTRVWVPAALIGETSFQKTLANTFSCDGGSAEIFENKTDVLGIVAAEFPVGVRPILTVTSRIATKDRAIDFTARGTALKEDRAALEHFLRPTRLLPTDGIVKAKANEITKGAKTDVEKARAIYEWIVDHAFRNPKTRGCGVGDIRFMLESGDLGGKCADLNALYVGLARASGLPARDAYGIRIAKSEMGYKSLGASSENVTKAQHCRAEVYLGDYGWVPVDPADVRKVVLEEPPGNRQLEDDLVKKARARLFGSWEMNWMAYNFAHDVALPRSNRAPVGFFMYPQAETADGRLDGLDPDNFKYEITSRETTSANG
jgi:transglutaminase-like putative cysteine protease